MNAYITYKYQDLLHFGIKQRSGRYPWGSGDRPYQRLEGQNSTRRGIVRKVGRAVGKALKVTTKATVIAGATLFSVAFLASVGQQWLQSPSTQNMLSQTLTSVLTKRELSRHPISRPSSSPYQVGMDWLRSAGF